jgi:dTDP-4-amino-4,6-dideoxygalactose transaminase
MIPLAIPNIGELEGTYLQQCVDTNFVSSVGPFVDHLENGIAERHGGVKGVATSSGTAALHVGLLSLGVSAGDIVICPSFTFIAPANAISHCHATPWLLDISADTWTLDPNQLRVALEQHTEASGKYRVHKVSKQRIAAIMPVYTLGTPADMEAVGQIAQEFNIPILADAAAAVGVSYKGQPLASVANLTAFSFNGNKTITSGGGGMLIGSDIEALARAKHLSTTARSSANYDYDTIGFNYRMTNIQAAVGCAQLERLDTFLDKKRHIRNTYNAAFENTPGLTLFPSVPGLESACWMSGLIIEESKTLSVASLCEKLATSGVEARPFWKPVHLQTPYQSALTFNATVSEELWSRIITLPCSTGLTDAEQQKEPRRRVVGK